MPPRRVSHWHPSPGAMLANCISPPAVAMQFFCWDSCIIKAACRIAAV